MYVFACVLAWADLNAAVPECLYGDGLGFYAFGVDDDLTGRSWNMLIVELDADRVLPCNSTENKKWQNDASLTYMYLQLKAAFS